MEHYTLRLLGLTVTCNESGRYLERFLAWNVPLFDDFAVYDDQSDDDTPRICASATHLKRRTADVPTFLDDESAFREAGWRWMEEALKPERGDWVLVLDADEFVVGDGDARELLVETTRRAKKQRKQSVSLHVPEVFAAKNVTPQIRVDGFWNDNFPVRLCEWKPDGRFGGAKMACGAVPTYASKNPFADDTVSILHYGYLKSGDRSERYQRYKERSGHNPLHVESIQLTPTLQGWTGRHPHISG